MRNLILVGILLAFTILIGCSGNGVDAIQPLPQPSEIKAVDVHDAGHQLFGYVNIAYDRQTGELMITENRSALAHFNVKPFILPPNCYDCLKIKLTGVDPFTQTYTFSIGLKNNTSLTAYDIRGIVMLDPVKNHQLLNADGYTPFWDDGLQPLINPFKAYATDQLNRVFGPGTTHKAEFQLYVPTGDFNIDFAVDASWPGNCKEPYEIVPPATMPKFDEEGKKSVNVDVIVKDWQGDIEGVWIDATAMGFPSLMPLSPISPDTYRATFGNIYLMPPGYYGLRIDAKSFGSVKYLHQMMTAEVYEVEPDRLAEVLDEMAKTKTTLKYSGTDLNFFVPDQVSSNTSKSTRLGYYDNVHRNILKYPEWAQGLTDDLHSNYSSFEKLIVSGSVILDEDASDVFYNYTPGTEPLLEALTALHSALGDPLNQTEKDQISSDAADVPMEVQVMAAKVLYGMKQGCPYRDQALSNYSTTQKNKLWDEAADILQGSFYLDILDYVVAYKYDKQYQAAAWVGAGLDDIRASLMSYTPSGDFDFNWTCPLGKVIIDGTGNSNYSDDEYCLIFDCGGDDTYGKNVAGNASYNNGFSVCIDLWGDDTYNSGATNQQGLGGSRHGTAVLWDVHGNDDYTGYDLSQGCGNWGVGILCDSEGTDTYNIDGIGQGAGYGGIGLLIDESGDDRYDTYHYAQGFGFLKGFGALIDMQGDDIYQANLTDIKYPSAQDAAHNSSMSQGCGFGLRLDGYYTFLSGGVGVMVDGGGNDYYETDIMGTAFAYWYCSGIIADYGDGNDEYRGYWYNVAGTAHYGSSIIFEYGGNDYYKCVASVGVGGAHDFSNSFLLDYNGDDTYDGSNYSLGGGNECGTGFCIDWNGTDTYNVDSEPSLGGGNFSTGRNRDSWGIFIDMGGTVDTYNDGSWPADNDAKWTKGAKGAGGDFANGDVIWQD